MAEQTYAYTPDYAIHPGEYLEEVLESRGIKKKEFAERLGISDKHLSEIINRKKMLTAEMSLKIEKILGISANIWNNLNADYELFTARAKADKELEKNSDWINHFPISDLKTCGFLPDTGDKKVLLSSLLNFFGISSPENWDNFFGSIAKARYRKSPAFTDNNYHITSWIQAGEILAQDITVNDFSSDKFQKNLFEIRKLTIEEPEIFEPKMKELCRQSGVALVFIPEFGSTHICGATTWLTSSKAVIMMSLRYKTNDHFWFTFFHEAGHIIKHGKKAIFIDGNDSFVSSQEDEANKFAKDMLIPESDYNLFVRENNFYADSIESFAAREKIHPGIVVGRLQHDNLIPHKWHNSFKIKFDFKKKVIR